jgi:hypothetical protein
LIGWSRRCPGCSGTPFFHHHLYGLRNTFVRHSLGWASSNHLDPREFMRFCHYDGSSSASTTRLRAASRSSQYPSKKESHVFSSTRGSGSSLYLVSRPVFRQLTNLALLTAVRLIGKDLQSRQSTIRCPRAAATSGGGLDRRWRETHRASARKRFVYPSRYVGSFWLTMFSHPSSIILRTTV